MGSDRVNKRMIWENAETVCGPPDFCYKSVPECIFSIRKKKKNLKARKQIIIFIFVFFFFSVSRDTKFGISFSA